MNNDKITAYLHTHSENSLKFSPLSVKDLVKRADELGIKTLALTDIGSMTGTVEFLFECKKYNISGIPGIEATFNDRLNSLVFVAKNNEGYKQICYALKEANKNIYKDDTSKLSYPIFSKEIIEKFFISDDVIILSSGVNSIFADILLSNIKINKKINEIKKLQKKCKNPNDASYIGNKEILAELEQEIEILTKEKERLNPIANKKLKKKLQALEVLKKTEPDNYEINKEILDKEIAERDKAKDKIIMIDSKLSDLKKRKKAVSLKVTAMTKQFKEWNKFEKQIESLLKEEKPEKEIYEECEAEILYFKEKFPNSFYIELNYHNDDTEKHILDFMLEMAKKHNIKTVICNESYMAVKEDIKKYQIMRSLKDGEWFDIGVADKDYYMKESDKITDSLLKVVSESDLKDAVQNTNDLEDSITFELPDYDLKENKHYPKYRDDNGNYVDSAKVLTERAVNGIKERGFDFDTFNDEYQKRLDMELDVIINMGFADYILIVSDFISYAKSLDNASVGPGRGSAAGSLVCYLLKITNINPIKYNLKFERFLNVNRITMPDIDVDFSESIKPKVVEYVAKKYGEESVAYIRTKQTQQGKNSIKNVARMLGLRDGDKDKYYELAKGMASKVGNEDSLAGYKDNILEEYNSDIAKEILDLAISLEGSMTGVSVHAAGVIIGDGKPLSEYAPIYYNQEVGTWVVACDMVQSEMIGLLKMDFLVLKNLDILSQTLKRIRKYEGKDINLDDISFDDINIYENIFSKGNTLSVFQLESSGMRQFMKEFSPMCFEDIIAGISLYRPGPMEFIPDIIKVKNKEKKPSYIIPLLEDILSVTYGYPVYQEQLMDIFSKCAGFSQGEADIVRRNMSKKKEEEFLKAKPKFIEGLISSGASNTDAEQYWGSLVDFAKYGFNKSHAAAYAVIAYYTAYLKYYYKEYYMCSCLNYADVDEIPKLLCECREMGIKILLPDINKSYPNFENDRNGIIYGITRIKGIANKVLPFIEERNINGYFKNFKDFVIRTKPSSALIPNLIDAGCFDGFLGGYRNASLSLYTEIIGFVENIEKSKKDLSALYDKLETIIDSKEKAKIKDKISKKEEELAFYSKKLLKADIDVDIKDTDENLKRECNLLGTYISKHPLDDYDSYFRSGKITLISDFSVGKDKKYAGLIKELRVVKRKKDGADMAFFKIEDISGTLDCCCFSESYKKYKSFINEGEVISVIGKTVEDSGVDKIYVSKIDYIKPYLKPIFISFKDENDYIDKYSLLKKYMDENGHPVIAHNQRTGDIAYTSFSIKKRAIKDMEDDLYIRELYNY